MELDLYVALHYSTGKFYNALEQYVYLRLRPVRSIRTRAGNFLLNALQLVLVIVAVGAFALLFKPLLVGIARAMVLVVRPKLSREERLARQQMREAQVLQRTLGKMDGVSPSNAAELRALSTRA